MRKLILGLVVGILIGSAVPAYAAVDSLIGHKVQSEMELTFNGASLGKMIVVDNKSYVPVRDIANALLLGLNVNKEEVALSGTVADDTTLTLEGLARQKADLEKQISKTELAINNYTNKLIPKAEELLKYAYRQESIDAANAELADDKSQLAQKQAALPELQAMLDSVNQQIADLQAQQ